MGQIDETEPGSKTDGADGVASQLTTEDMLLNTGIEDVLDEGYSPPDRRPAVDVPTPAEEIRGRTLSQQLADEVPDVWRDERPDWFEEQGEEVGGRRAGRLVDSEFDGFTDVEKDMIAGDVGIDGAAASAEEAAVHVIDEFDQR